MRRRRRCYGSLLRALEAGERKIKHAGGDGKWKGNDHLPIVPCALTFFLLFFFFLHFTIGGSLRGERCHTIRTCSRTLKRKKKEKKKKKKTLCRNLHTPVKRNSAIRSSRSRGGHAHKQAWLNRPSTLSANSAIQDRCFCFLLQKKKKKRSTANQQLKLQRLLELMYSHVYDNLSNLLCR